MSATTPLSSPASSKAQAYERLRPLIIWLGICELVWIACWLFARGSSAPAFHAGVAAWLVVMLSWMALVTGPGSICDSGTAAEMRPATINIVETPINLLAVGSIFIFVGPAGGGGALGQTSQYSSR